MSDQYTNEKLSEIEQNIISGIDKHDAFLKDIEDLAGHITDKLVGNNHTKAKFQDTEYVFSLSCNKETKEIMLMRTDPIKFLIGNGKYRPAIFRGEWDMNFTYRENVYMVVKTALCSAAGIINIDALTESQDE